MLELQEENITVYVIIKIVNRTDKNFMEVVDERNFSYLKENKEHGCQNEILLTKVQQKRNIIP